MRAMMRRAILLGLVLAGPPMGPAGAQDPGYRMVTPPQQTPLPWHGAPAPLAAPGAQAAPPDLAANHQRLRQSRQAREAEEMRNALIGNALRPRNR